MLARGWVGALAVRPETALDRIVTQSGDAQPAALRPMLSGDDPLARMHALHARRADWYRAADETIVADELSADEVAARIVAGLVARGALPASGATDHVRHVRRAAGSGYDAVVAWGGLASLPERLRALGLPSRLHVVADAQVARLYEPALMAALLRAGFEPLVFRVPAGEASKSRLQLDAIHDWLAERRAERGEALVALGAAWWGSGGLAAATYRGLPLIKCLPRCWQVDASIGGKVAIDHPRGKPDRRLLRPTTRARRPRSALLCRRAKRGAGRRWSSMAWRWTRRISRRWA
jgi:hypothetical protein